MAGKERAKLASARETLQEMEGKESAGHILNAQNWKDCLEALRKAKDEGESYVNTSRLRELIGSEDSDLGYIISFLDDQDVLECWNSANQIQDRSYPVSQYTRKELDDLEDMYREFLGE